LHVKQFLNLNKQSTTNQESALVDGNKKALLKSEGLNILREVLA